MFVIKCIHPTGTLTEGKEYEVFEHSPHSDNIVVKNNFGNKITVQKWRFDKLREVEDKKEVKIRCITNKFKNVTQSKTYTPVKEDKEYYYIYNNRNFFVKYSKKYFTLVEEDKVEEKPKYPVCIFPIPNILLYNKQYKLKKVDNMLVEVTGEDGKTHIVSKKRFKV